jgi:hypothetical protein
MSVIIIDERVEDEASKQVNKRSNTFKQLRIINGATKTYGSSLPHHITQIGTITNRAGAVCFSKTAIRLLFVGLVNFPTIGTAIPHL